MMASMIRLLGFLNHAGIAGLRKVYDGVSYAIFLWTGKKPWTAGYDVYKYKNIKALLKEDNFSSQKLPKGYGFRVDERIVEYPWFFSRLPAVSGTLLDAGSTLNFDFIMSHPSLASKKIFISTLAPEPQCFWNRGVSYVFEDVRDTCYRNGYFDWVVSISTIEHIGLDNTMLYTNDPLKKENLPDSYLLAVKEYHRVLKKGGILYLTVPFGKQANRGWFQVFDAAMIDSIIATFAPAGITEQHFKYEPDGWWVSSRVESKDRTCFDIHQQKKYDKDYAAFSRAIVCLELTK